MNITRRTRHRRIAPRSVPQNRCPAPDGNVHAAADSPMQRKGDRNVMLKRTISVTRSMEEVPAALDFVKLAGTFKSTIRVTCGQQGANAKSTLSVLALKLKPGSELSVEIDGPDSEQAMQALADFLTA